MWKASVGKKNVHRPWSLVMLVAALAMAIGPEIAEMDAWSVARSPGWVGHNLHLVASVLMAWVSQFISKAE